MKDYKRLTKSDWHDAKFDAAVNKEHRAVLHRLWDIENRIERGEIVDRNSYLDYLMAAKNTLELTDKEIEFFAKHNARVRTSANAEIARLTAENAELRAKIEKAVELPCKVGDTIYQTDTNGTRIFKSTVKNIIFETDGVAFDERAIGESIFLTEEAVKEKMKKLQEKNND